MPHSSAQITVEATVVPPFNFNPSTYGKSLREVFIAFDLPSANSVSSFVDNPILTRPRRIAIVAGVAPYRERENFHEINEGDSKRERRYFLIKRKRGGKLSYTPAEARRRKNPFHVSGWEGTKVLWLSFSALSLHRLQLHAKLLHGAASNLNSLLDTSRDTSCRSTMLMGTLPVAVLETIQGLFLCSIYCTRSFTTLRT